MVEHFSAGQQGACWSFWAHTRRRGAFSSTLFRSAKNNTICRVVRRRNSFRILRHTNFFSFLTASPLKISWWNGDSSASDQVLATPLRITFVSIRDIFKSDKRTIFTWLKEYWIEIVSFFIILFHLIMHCTKLLESLISSWYYSHRVCLYMAHKEEGRT